MELRRQGWTKRLEYSAEGRSANEARVLKLEKLKASRESLKKVLVKNQGNHGIVKINFLQNRNEMMRRIVKQRLKLVRKKSRTVTKLLGMQ